MDCAQTRAHIECYVDGELDPMASASVEAHLHGCVACQHAVDRLVSLGSLIREGMPYRAAPDRLRQKIRSRLDSEADASAKGIGAWWGQWWRPVALVAVTAVVTWIAASQLHKPMPNERVVVREVIASHARSTLTGHRSDIASSERHTVKPWLSSKLDFSPPVMDLTDAGFPLAGGRLDYVDNRPVAVLVYRRRQHLIDVFIWPGAQASLVPPSLAPSERGYQVMHWAQGGMTFWAISDLNATELKSFATNFASSK